MKSIALQGSISNFNVNIYAFVRDLFQTKGGMGEFLGSRQEAQHPQETLNFFDRSEELDTYVRSFRE